jgi:hypothetical protein
VIRSKGRAAWSTAKATATPKATPFQEGKSHGENSFALAADSCRQNTVDNAVVVIDGMTNTEHFPDEKHSSVAMWRT